MSRYFYIVFSIWSAFMVLLGFWPKYFGPLSEGTLSAQLIIHIHAVIFSGWIILFFFQAFWIYKRQVSQHIKLGNIGIYYGTLVMITGLVTAIIRRNFHTDLGNEAAAIFSFAAGIRDVTVFGILFFLAIYFRKTPSKHRIWILGASAYILVPAVARAAGFLFHGSNYAFYTLWLLPVVTGIVVEKNRKNPYLWHYALVLMIMIISGESLGLLVSIL